MTLYDLSEGYRESADLIKMRLFELRGLERIADDPEEVFRLKMRIGALQPLMWEMRDLADLTARYYERGYDRNDFYTF
ncbi:MAG: hypothetical protein LKJ86_02010 [Oscillibacter sp.]|jgi:hypothetical protein|nr:hypothetical protein [Oscillibacter sp.]